MLIDHLFCTHVFLYYEQRTVRRDADIWWFGVFCFRILQYFRRARKKPTMTIVFRTFFLGFGFTMSRVMLTERNKNRWNFSWGGFQNGEFRCLLRSVHRVHNANCRLVLNAI